MLQIANVLPFKMKRQDRSGMSEKPQNTVLYQFSSTNWTIEHEEDIWPLKSAKCKPCSSCNIW